MGRVDFFIVGAMRAGTSSLRDALMLNPHINIPRGEPMFFSHESRFREGLDSYHELFDWKNDYSIRGEKSPPYSVTPGAAERLKSYNPSAKIVWMLREPVARAISHYQHSLFRRGEDALSLKEAVQKREELEAISSTMAYVFRSEYHKQIEHWLEYFPREQHHVIILEELLASPEMELRRLHDFLGAPWSEGVTLPHSKNRKMAEFVKKVEISEADVQVLEEALSDTKPEVERLLGRSLPAWKRPRRGSGWLGWTIGR
jgi:hypothetical protein